MAPGVTAVLAVLCLQACISAVLTQDFVSSVSVSAQTDEMVGANPGAYQTQPFNISTTITADNVYLTNGSIALTVILKPPGYLSTYASCSTNNQFLDGTSSTTGCTDVSHFDEYSSVNTDDVKFSIGSAFIRQSGAPVVVDTHSTNGQIEIQFGTITNITEGLAAEEYEIDIYFDDVTLVKKNKENEFMVTAIASSVDYGVTQNESSASVKVYYKGPRLIASVSSGDSGLSAGDSVTYTVSLDHAGGGASTETANNVQVSFGVSESSAMTLTSGTYTWSGQAQSSLTNINQQLTKASLTTSDTLTATLIFSTNDLIPLHSSLDLTVIVNYKTSGSYVMSLNALGKDAVTTASVDFGSMAGDSGWKTNLAAGQGVNLIKGFTLPRGTLYLTFVQEVQTTDIDEVPVTPVSNALVFPNYIQVDPTKITGGAASFNTFKRKKRSSDDGRVKRSTVAQTAERNFGAITNPSSGGVDNAPVSFNIEMAVVDPSVGGQMILNTYLDINGVRYTWETFQSTLSKPILNISKSIQMEDDSVEPNIVRINVSVEHTTASNSPAYDVRLVDGDSAMGILWALDRVGPSITQLTINAPNNRWTWAENPLAVIDSMFMSFASKPANDGADLPDTSVYTATVKYKSGPEADAQQYTETASICIAKVESLFDDLFTNYGFTVLALLGGLILGILIIIIVIIVMILVCKRWLFADGSVRPQSAYDMKVDKVSGQGLITNSSQVKKFAKENQRVGREAMKGVSNVSVGDSIIKILSMKDKLLMERELENLDIMQSSRVDDEIESERNNSIINTTVTLLKNMEKNGDMKGEVVNKSVGKFKRALSDLDKKLDNDYQNDVSDIYNELSRKNKSKLSDLLAAQEERREEMEEKLKNSTLPADNQKQVLQSLDKEMEAEQEELNNRLKLEQEEKVEELRKEYNVRKRLGIEELESDMLREAQDTAQLSEEQADWLQREHQKNQIEVKRIYGEEMARQRMVLNEKLERRRLLAKSKDTQEEHINTVINTFDKQEHEAIKKMKKEGVIDQDEAEVLLKEAKQQIAEVKQKMAVEKERQSAELHKKLGERKKRLLEEKAKKHQQELQELEKKQAALQTSESYTNPVALVEERQKMISNQRAELNAKENEIDTENAAELAELYDDINNKTQEELKSVDKNTMKKLEEKGLDEDQMKKILDKHEKEINNLEQERELEKSRQEENFKLILEKRRRQSNEKRERESKEQEQVREHEEKVVRKLVISQVAMSEGEREKIMKEHEKHMAKMESSLTLDKIRQKRMLEEKLAQKRAKKMEKLQKNQEKESKKSAKAADADSDLDEEDKFKAEIDLLKKQSEDRMALLKGDDVEVEDELEEIEAEMGKEREAALQDQEVRLGAMLAELQLNKAKEMARIEEQQKAIHNLKSNLMDDLNEKGILSDPECQKVIEIHQKEQEQLSSKLESQRAKQEKKLRRRLREKLSERELQLKEQQRGELDQKEEEEEALRKKLQSRMKQKEDTMNKRYEREVSSALGGANTPAAKIRRMALMHKHQMEMQAFRNRIEKEIDQTLEEMRRQHDIKRMSVIQDQELQFINGLVRLGKFKKDELENVVVMLFPTKSEEERKELLDQLMEGYKPRQDSDSEKSLSDDGDKKGEGTLVERVKSATYGRRLSQKDTSPHRGNHKKLSKFGKKKRGSIYEDEEEGAYGRLRERPEPVGRSYTPDYNSEEENYRRVPPTRLPPMPEAGKKKKKGKKKKTAVDPDDDDYF